ncbi:unnamed protein product [Phytomonas sp. EM1]|nr:unnamed protein product [Phytomonas sp. EM1]|eukprot:CCW59537.1 unnamed protein product [Phytomonas sp. isolate EM1]
MDFPNPKHPPLRSHQILDLHSRRRPHTLRSAPTTVGSNPNERGLLYLLERRQLPQDYDLEVALTSGDLIQARKAPIYNISQRKKKPITMTNGSVFSAVRGYKLDYDEIGKLPKMLDVAGLKAWEEVQRSKAHEKESRPSVETFMQNALTLSKSDTHGRDDPRTYTELLDLYSMHEFIIRKGKTLRCTPEFASFKRHYEASWDCIETMLEVLEDFLTLYEVELAYIDGKKLATLASYQMGRRVETSDLLNCIANAEEITPLLTDSAKQYRLAVKGEHLAATKIQSTWRMYRQRIAYRHLQLGTRAATIIQHQWTLHRSHCMTRRAIRAARANRLARWAKTMESFCEKWSEIRSVRRVAVHIPSLSIPSFQSSRVPFYNARQMGLLPRLFDLKDPNVEVVLVAPFRPQAEIMKYYHSLLANVGVHNSEGRLTLVVPEDVDRLKNGMSLTRLTLLSPRVMKVLKTLCTGKPAYIVPGVIGPEELDLVSELNVPLLSSDPRIAQVFGTKSGCKRLLEASDVAQPLGATALRSRDHLLLSLVNLMVEHRDINRWLIKLDTECGSRGHAYLDTSRMKSLKECQSSSHSVLSDALHKELVEFGARRVRLVHPHCYRDWNAYLTMVETVGACVEAVPNRVLTNLSANLFIEPSGEIHLQSVVEPLLAPAFTVLGSCFPCSIALNTAHVESAAMRVATAAFRKRIYGYVSVDFVLFEKETSISDSGSDSQSSSIWAVDVDLCLTNNAAAHQVASMLLIKFIPSATLPPIKDRDLDMEGNDVELHYIYSGLIYNPFISSIRHEAFFSLCHAKGISFDRKEQTGIVFHLVDVLLRGCVGVISVARNINRALKKMTVFQNLLNMELPKQGEHSAESNIVYFLSIQQQLSRLKNE